jgi:hypothetical protein
MSHYVHHVPGRLRVRSRAFQCNPAKARGVAQELRTMEGVHDVRYNERIGSLTVQYQPGAETGSQVMAALSAAGCLPVSGRTSRPAGPDLGAAFGKAVVAALAQQTVARSFSSLAAVLR